MDYMRVMLQGVRTLVPEEGVAYIEYAWTLTVLHYKGLNVHKVRGVTGNASLKYS